MAWKTDVCSLKVKVTQVKCKKNAYMYTACQGCNFALVDRHFKYFGTKINSDGAYKIHNQTLKCKVTQVKGQK